MMSLGTQKTVLLSNNYWKANLQTLGVIIDYVETMTHILSSLPEKYENIVKNLEEKLDYDIDMLTIEIIR